MSLLFLFFFCSLLISPSVFNQYKEKQEEFKEVHKEVDRIRTSGFEPSALKRDIQNLEEEKVQLGGRLNKSKKKVQDVVCQRNERWGEG